MLKDRLCRVTSYEVAREELTDELDVTEELVLMLHLLILVVGHRVRLACLFVLFLDVFKLLILEDLLKAATTVVKQLLAEGAELKVRRDSLLALGFEIDLDNGGAKLTVELGVGVLDLGLTEDSLDHD